MNPVDDPRAKLLTVEDVADALAVRPSTVTRWLKDGRIPFVKLGGRWRIAESDLIAWIEERKERKESGA